MLLCFWNILLNLLFPSKCYVCAANVASANTICSDCWQELDFIIQPICRRCGERALNEHYAQYCSCAGKSNIKAVRSALYFNEMAQDIIHKYKYEDGTEIQRTLAQWVANAADDLRQDIDCLVPIPLHAKRLQARKYNQAALIAKHIGKLWAKPMIALLLQRTRNTLPQVGLRHRQRQKNIAKAFAVDSSLKHVLEGKNIALIDDVVTTGATAKECAGVLMQNGARQVYLLTVVRQGVLKL